MASIVPAPEARPAQVLPAPLAPSTAILSGAETRVRIAIAGSRLVTVRGLASVGGSLDFYFVHPDGTTRYTASNPTSVTVVDATEFATTITCNGEAILEIAFTPSGDTTLSFLHVYQL